MPPAEWEPPHAAAREGARGARHRRRLIRAEGADRATGRSRGGRDRRGLPGEIPEVRVNRLLLGNTDVRGCSFGVLGLAEQGMAPAFDRLGELIAAGSLRPMIGSVYPLQDAQRALHELSERRATGKVVIALDGAGTAAKGLYITAHERRSHHRRAQEACGPGGRPWG